MLLFINGNNSERRRWQRLHQENFKDFLNFFFFTLLSYKKNAAVYKCHFFISNNP